MLTRTPFLKAHACLYIAHSGAVWPWVLSHPCAGIFFCIQLQLTCLGDSEDRDSLPSLLCRSLSWEELGIDNELHALDATLLTNRSQQLAIQLAILIHIHVQYCEVLYTAGNQLPYSGYSVRGPISAKHQFFCPAVANMFD